MVISNIEKTIEKAIQLDFLEHAMSERTMELCHERILQTKKGDTIFVAYKKDSNTIEVFRTLLLYYDVKFRENEKGNRIKFERTS